MDTHWEENQITQERAKAILDSGIWGTWDHHQRIKSQLFQRQPLMPTHAYQHSLETVLGRPVMADEIELGNATVVDEYIAKFEAPTVEENEELIKDFIP